MNSPSTKDELQIGYIRAQLNYAPETNGKKFVKWCEGNGFVAINSGRRAWSSSLRTYLRGAAGVAYADGESFLFYEEDLVELETICDSYHQQKLDKILEEWPEPLDELAGYSVPDAFNLGLDLCRAIIEGEK